MFPYTVSKWIGVLQILWVFLIFCYDCCIRLCRFGCEISRWLRSRGVGSWLSRNCPWAEFGCPAIGAGHLQEGRIRHNAHICIFTIQLCFPIKYQKKVVFSRYCQHSSYFTTIAALGSADSAARSQDGSDRGELAADCLATILGQNSAAQPLEQSIFNKDA